MKLKKRGLRKKGQAAIFIILAAIILFGGIYFFSTQIALTERKTKVPQEFEPVAVLVDECLRQKTEEGLETIGLTGGYIDLPDETSFNSRSYFPAPPDAGIKIPYWWYEHGKDKLMPSESKIKAQLEKFISSNATECIDNFRALENQFEVTPKSEMSVKVSFNEENVGVDVDYDIEAYSKLRDQKITINRFYYDSGVRFKKVFELAGKIMERENKDFFLEQKTIDLMEHDLEYNEEDPPKAIPMVFMEFPNCLRRKWKVSDVQSRVQELLLANIPFIKLPEADISLDTYVPNPCLDPRFKNHELCELEPGKAHQNTYADSYFKNNFLWEIDPNAKDRYKNMEVSFRYDNLPLQMEVRPRDGAYLKSNLEKSAGVLRFLCTNVWHFTYDIAYPINVAIYDKPNSKNQPYLFNFAFKVAMRSNNEATDRQSIGSSPLAEIGTIDSEDYCANNLQRGLTIIETIDSNGDGDALDGVELEYSCPPYSCDMGKTEMTQSLQSAILQKQFPMCLGGGKLTATKQGYRENTTFVITNHNSNSVVARLDALKDFGKIDEDNPIKSTSYKVYKIELLRPTASGFVPLKDSTRDDFRFSSVKELEPDEKATIVIEESTASDNAEPHQTFGSYPPETDEANVGDAGRLSVQPPITLFRDYDKTYRATIYLSDKEGEKVKGMYESDWIVKKQDVRNSNRIEFYVIQFTPNPNLSAEEQEEEMAYFQSEIAYFSQELNKQNRQPQFK